MSLIQSGSYAAADDEAGKFKANFSSNVNFSKAMFHIGGEYYKKAVFSDANAPLAEADELYGKAVSAWQTVLQEPQSYAFTPAAYYLSGRYYYKSGQYNNAINCCQRVSADWPDCEYACRALLTAGRSWEKLLDAGQIAKSEAESQITAVCNQILEKYPGCEAVNYAGHWLSKNISQ